jgi:hypothetical protein
LIEPPASVLSYATLSLGVHAGHCPNDLPALVRTKGHNLRGAQQLAEASVLDIQYVLNAIQLHHGEPFSSVFLDRDRASGIPVAAASFGLRE